MPPKEGMLSKISSLFSKTPPPKTPITGFGVRLKNIINVHWRGLVGVIVPLIVVSVMIEKENNSLKTALMWGTMVWWFLVRPVNIPVTGLIPIFYGPMFGIIQTIEICGSYMNDHIMLFLLTSILILLLNNSGVDRRVILSFMTSGDSSQFHASKLVYKCSIAAFFMSIFSSRLITASIVTEYLTTAMLDIESKGAKSKDEANLKEVRYVVVNAIHTSSSIGSLAIVHSAFATLTFRAIFADNVPDKAEYPDLFNYLQYSAFAVPVTTVMFVLNLVYHMYLVNKAAGKPMSKASRDRLQKLLIEKRNQIPSNMSLHEKQTIFFTAVFLICHVFRWSEWLGGWAAYRMDTISKPETPLPAIRDATCSAILVVLTHSLPSSYNFLKYFTASKRSQLPPRKMESGILWWRFVDKNLNYGYFFLIGSGVALMTMTIKTKLNEEISAGIGANITSLGWTVGTLVIILISAILSNIISGTAACVSFLPFVLSATCKAEEPWPGRSYLAALAVGMASSFGFTYPFLYTPAYYSYYIGRVPVKKMITNSFISVLLCVIILWVAILFYAPIIWDPEGKGIYVIQGAAVVTTPAAAGSATEETPEPEGA